MLLYLDRPVEISSSVLIFSSWLMPPCGWSSSRTCSASRKEDFASSRVEKSQGIISFYPDMILQWIAYIIVKPFRARIFDCQQWSASLNEVYVQKTQENLMLFTSARGDGGAERKQISGQGRVLLGLQSPAWGNKATIRDCKLNSMQTLNLNIIHNYLTLDGHIKHDSCFTQLNIKHGHLHRFISLVWCVTSWKMASYFAFSTQYVAPV